MFTVAQANKGVLISYDGGDVATKEWVEENFLPLHANNNEFGNYPDNSYIRCRTGDDWSMLTVGPAGARYMKKRGSTETDGEIATLADIPPSMVVHHDGTLDGDGTEESPLKQVLTTLEAQGGSLGRRVRFTNNLDRDIYIGYALYDSARNWLSGFQIYDNGTSFRIQTGEIYMDIDIDGVYVRTTSQNSTALGVQGDVVVSGGIRTSSIILDAWTYDDNATEDNYDTWSNHMLCSAELVKYAVSHANTTITHHTQIVGSGIGRFCETTGVIYDGYPTVGITDCITQQKIATTLNTKILGVITGPQQFASHGDVLVMVDDGEYKLGDLLVPTATAAKVATEDEKLFIMVNGLPRVRVTAITDARIPKLDDKVCLACFIG
jgi:hypothetical protein